MNPAWALVIFFVIIVGVILYALKKSMDSSAAFNAKVEAVLKQKREFVISMSPRQRALHASFQGQDYPIVIMQLEQRIFELEERLALMERVSYDDGK